MKEFFFLNTNLYSLNYITEARKVEGESETVNM